VVEDFGWKWGWKHYCKTVCYKNTATRNPWWTQVICHLMKPSKSQPRADADALGEK